MSRGDEAIVYGAADWRCQLRRVPGAKKACRSRPDRRESGRGVLGPSDRGRRAERGVAIDFQFDSATDGKAIKIASMIDERETNFGPFASVRDTPRIAGILRMFATGFLAEVARFRTGRQGYAAHPLGHDGDRAAGVLDLTADQ